MANFLSANHLIYAALMHDIGKVIQRTDISKQWDSKKHTDKCVFAKGRDYPTYKHSMYTAEFLERYALPLKDWETVIELAGCHHNKSVFQHTEFESYLNYLTEADRVAASWDREKSEDTNTDPNNFRKVPLYSIFDTISFDKGQKQKIINSIPLKKRTPVDVIKLEADVQKRDRSGDYTSLWNSFIADFEKVHSFYYSICQKKGESFIEDHYAQFIDAADSLLEQYFWCVPANTNEPFPTNSLYHHSRNTATIAAALCQSRNMYNSSKDSGSKEFFIISGDLNGIQSYLYDLNPEKASKTSKLLRSRSFQVRMIMEMISLKIVNELQLSRLNIFMSAGGKWLILAPNNKEVRDKLLSIKYEIEEELYIKYLGSLSVNINWKTQADLNDLNKSNFINTLSAVIDNTEEEKLRRFSTYLMETTAKENDTIEKSWSSAKFIINNDPLYNNSICPLCYKRGVSSGETDEDREGERICSNCDQEIRMGELLVKESFYTIYPDKDNQRQGTINFAKMSLKNVQLQNEKLFNPIPGRFYFRIKDDNDYCEIPLRQIATAVPKDSSGRLLTFEEIAESSYNYDKDEGIKANAVVKGDVDNLGLIFQQGLLKKNEKGELYCSITDYTTLSSLMDYYFAVYLPYIIQQKYDNSIYTVYAGGDDFCLVGAYDKVIDFTITLNRDFNQFTCHNSDLHFSAAVRLMHPKEPVKFAINDTDNYLKEAKRAVIKGQSKNKLWLFETVVPWDKVPELIELSQKFDDYLESNQIGIQFLYRLLTYTEMYLETKKEKTDIRNYLYDTLLHYDIRRNVEKIRNNIIINKDLTDQFRQLSVVSGESNMDYLRIPLCKTIYQKRNSN